MFPTWPEGHPCRCASAYLREACAECSLPHHGSAPATFVHRDHGCRWPGPRQAIVTLWIALFGCYPDFRGSLSAALRSAALFPDDLRRAGNADGYNQRVIRASPRAGGRDAGACSAPTRSGDAYGASAHVDGRAVGLCSSAAVDPNSYMRTAQLVAVLTANSP
jgi:hypothetical protein